MFDNKQMSQIAKAGLAQLIRQAEDDAKYFERKAKGARASASMLRTCRKMLAEMLKPPKPFKFKPPSKRELKRLAKLGAFPVLPTVKVSQ